MGSRFIGGLALVALIATAATLSTVNHARADEVTAPKEVIKVSAPAPLAPLVVSLVSTNEHKTIHLTRAAAGVDVVMCVVAERGGDSLTAVNDSLLGRLRVVIPRRFESTVAPPSPRGTARSRASASTGSSDSSRSPLTSRSLRSS